MPRPAAFKDLLHLDGGPGFRTGGWWDVFQEARMFYPRGFLAAMDAAGISSACPIAAKLDQAQRLIAVETDWLRRFPTRHWNSTASNQAANAASGKPMLLPNIAICVEALQLAADDDDAAPEGFDAYKMMQVVPGAYKLAGFPLWCGSRVFERHGEASVQAVALGESGAGTRDVVNTNGIELREVAAEVESAGIAEQGDRLLNDLIAGLHAPHSVASFVHEKLGKPRDIGVQLATRPGQTGVKPATEQIRFQ